MLDNLKLHVFSNVVAFTKVVETKSFTAAARQLGMSKATVSKQVTMLETRIGVRLLNRTTRTLSLTSAGSGFYQHCRHIVAELNAAEVEVMRLGSEPYGDLRVGVCAAIGRLHVAPVIGEFLKRYQNVKVDLTLSEQYVDLTGGEFDVAILAACGVRQTPRWTRLAPCVRVICAAPGYLDLHGRPETVDDLLEHSCITCTEPSDRGAWSLEGSKGLEIARVNGRFRTDSWEALRMAALSGHGLALIPLFLANDDLDVGRLLRVLPAYRDLSRSIYAVCFGPGPVSANVEAFVTFIELCFAAFHDRMSGRAPDLSSAGPGSI